MNNNSISESGVVFDLFPNGTHSKVKYNERYVEASGDIKNYLNSIIPIERVKDLCWVHTCSPDEVHHYCRNSSGVVNLCRVNDVRDLSLLLERVNHKLTDGAYYIVCLEAKNQHKKRILNKYPRGINSLVYTFDFFFNRVLPKLKITRMIYFKISNGRNLVMTCTEALGRLVCCGFSIIDMHEFGSQTIIVTRKNGNPVFDQQATYGVLCKLQRIGKNGNIFTVYKLRTMHPYSEYLQEFMVENNNLKKGGKINDDFRITSWGRFLRKFWIDELPMLWNWLRREMKLVGVRPLSLHYYSLYPEEFRSIRNMVRPGLIPPFYADLPETLEEIIESERMYIESYLLKPVRTDVQYFCKAFYNILIRKARSQ